MIPTIGGLITLAGVNFGSAYDPGFSGAFAEWARHVGRNVTVGGAVCDLVPDAWAEDTITCFAPAGIAAVRFAYCPIVASTCRWCRCICAVCVSTNFLQLWLHSLFTTFLDYIRCYVWQLSRQAPAVRVCVANQCNGAGATDQLRYDTPRITSVTSAHNSVVCGSFARYTRTATTTARIV